MNFCVQGEIMNNPSPRCSGIFIPIELYEREDLSFFEIHLLSWVDLLYCKKHGGCFASNEYLASKLRNARINTVAKALTALRQKGLIEDVSFDGRKRVIRALINRSVDQSQSKSALDLNPTLNSSIGFLSNPPLEENPSYPYTEKKDEKKRECAATPLATFFYEKLKGINPKIKKPNLQAWEKELSKIRKDGEGNTDEEIRKVIEYLISTHGSASSNGFCWANVTLSAASLRKNYGKIWGEMKNVIKPKAKSETPYEKVSKLFKDGEKYNNAECYLTKEYLAFQRGMKNESVKLDQYFTWEKLEKLCDSFKIKIKE